MDYEARLHQLQAELNGEYAAHSTTILLLIGLVLGAGFLAWTLSPLAIAIAPIPGYLLFKRMSRSSGRISELRLICAFYNRSIARVNHKWMDEPQTGDEYNDSAHIYSPDLDLFGRGSLFQLMCIARTGVGRDALARYMTEIAGDGEATARADAVDELRNRSDLREAVAAAGRYSFSDCRSEVFSEWLQAPSHQFTKWAAPVAFLLSCGVPCLLVLALTRTIPAAALLPYVFIWIAVSSAFYSSLGSRVTAIVEDIGRPSVELAILADLIAIVEKQTFTAPKLKSLSKALAGEKTPASVEIARLRRIMGVFETGRKYLDPLTWLALWDTQFALAIDRWRERQCEGMRQWLNAVGEFEALNAVAAYAVEHSGDARVEFVDGPQQFEATGLGHPLLDERKCVRNDVHLGDGIPLWIVSGSNMSGKSTLLRSCGMAVVLASMGAPVRANKCRMSNLAVGAAIRLQDSLIDGKSKFYAEVARLKQIIDLAGERPVLFLVDEMLSGTNSVDRRTASAAVIRALLKSGAIGLTTTHDLALTRIADDADVRALNVHLADSADSGGLDFDYTLRPGVVQRSNALAIVEMLGIPLAKLNL
jgi:hypothetical protein